MSTTEKMTSLENVLCVLDGKIPDRVPSFCLGGDFDFVHKFMNSPYALTEEDKNQLDKDKISYSIPFMHAVIAKFAPRNYLPGGLDAKIDLCWKTVGGANLLKFDFTDEFVTTNGGLFKIVVREEGIPHVWYAGPALLKKEYIKTYWEREKDLTCKKADFKNLKKQRTNMLKKYDVVVSNGISGPFENCVFGIGFANFARFARKEPEFLQEHRSEEHTSELQSR